MAVSVRELCTVVRGWAYCKPLSSGKIFLSHPIISYILYQEVEKIQFSENVDTYDDKMTFQDINVSRPLMKVRISLDIN